MAQPVGHFLDFERTEKITGLDRPESSEESGTLVRPHGFEPSSVRRFGRFVCVRTNVPTHRSRLQERGLSVRRQRVLACLDSFLVQEDPERHYEPENY